MQLGVTARTVSEVRGAGPHSAQNDVYRGLAYTRLVSGLKVEEAAPDCLCDPVVRLITLAARTGQRGAGVIFVSTLDAATKSGPARAARRQEHISFRQRR